jgi:hypothetical protein
MFDLRFIINILFEILFMYNFAILLIDWIEQLRTTSDVTPTQYYIYLGLTWFVIAFSLATFIEYFPIMFWGTMDFIAVVVINILRLLFIF